MNEKLLIFLILATLLLAPPGCSKTSPDKDVNSLAWVNGQIIPRADFVRTFHDARAGNTQALPEDPVTWLQVKVAFLDQMIQRLLIEQEAARRGLTMVEQDVDETLSRMKMDWPKGSFDSVLAEKQMDEAQLKEAIRHDLLTGVLAKEVVLPTIENSEDEILSYYRTHPDEFSRPEQVRARQILVATEAEAAEILTRLLSGENMPDLSRKFSIAPEAEKGGDLGYFGRSQMPKVVEHACFALDVHQVSDIIKSEYGYHIFRVEDKRPAVVIHINTAREEISKKLRDEKLDQAWKEFLNNLKKTAQIEMNEALLASINQDEI